MNESGFRSPVLVVLGVKHHLMPTANYRIELTVRIVTI